MSGADKRQRRTLEKFESDLLMEKRRSLEAEVYFERNLLAELCRHFYNLGWFMGTGGSISVRVRANSLPPPGQQLLVMSPSGVQKERLVADDMFVLLPDGTEVLTPNTRPYPHKTLYSTGSAPLFLKVYELCNAGAIIHTHAMEACLVSRIDPLSKEFRISHMEMIKGIEGHWYEDELVVPIIENTDLEAEIVHALTEAIKAYPKTRAVLIRNHGVYVWGDSWITAKTQAECYHYLFEAALKLRQLGLPCVASSQLQVPHRA